MDKYDNFKNSRNIYAIIYLSIALLNIQYSVMTYLAGLKVFTIVCIVSTIFDIMLAILAKKVKNLDVCFILCFFHIVFFSMFGTLMVGYSSGFTLYLICLVPLCCYLLHMLSARQRRVRITVIILLAAYLISTFLSASNIVRAVEIKTIYHKALYFTNAIYSSVVLIAYLNVYLKKLAK